TRASSRWRAASTSRAACSSASGSVSPRSCSRRSPSPRRDEGGQAPGRGVPRGPRIPSSEYRGQGAAVVDGRAGEQGGGEQVANGGVEFPHVLRHTMPRGQGAGGNLPPPP